MADKIVTLHTGWLATRAAAERLGVTRRTLQRWASAGRIEVREGAGGVTEYRVTPDVLEGATLPATEGATSPVVSHATVSQGATSRRVAGSDGIDALRAELATMRRELVDAERRAAVAEYRAALVEGADAEVEVLTARVDELAAELDVTRAERDEARTLAQTYGDALRRRHATVQRLLQRIRGA